jgi:hypothetical protein
MRNLKLLSLTDDDRSITTSNVENSPSDAENGRKNDFFLHFIFIKFLFR